MTSKCLGIYIPSTHLKFYPVEMLEHERPRNEVPLTSRAPLGIGQELAPGILPLITPSLCLAPSLTAMPWENFLNKPLKSAATGQELLLESAIRGHHQSFTKEKGDSERSSDLPKITLSLEPRSFHQSAIQSTFINHSAQRGEEMGALGSPTACKGTVC